MIRTISLTALLLASVLSCSKPAASALGGWEIIDGPDTPLTPGKDDPENPSDPTDTTGRKPWFRTIGLCFRWDDCKYAEMIDYLAIAKKSGINCFSVYNPPRESKDWKDFESECMASGIDIEWEEHMMSYLIPRDYFEKHPEYYRMDRSGARVADCNGCASNPEVLGIIKNRAEFIAKQYKSTNNKYYCWLDDNSDVCYCDKCKDLSPSDQALIFENATLEGLRRVNPDATLSHLAYQRTLPAPTKVEPAEGIFLEFAPVNRNKYLPLSTTWAECSDGHQHKDYLNYLRDNLKVFPAETAQVLEYWLDASFFSAYDERNLKEVYWSRNMFLDDLKTYSYYGIKDIVTFSFWVGPDYVRKFGYPDFLEDYGKTMSEFVK